MGRLRQTRCKQGHAFTAENTEVYTSAVGRVWRRCKACNSQNRKARYTPNYQPRTHCMRGHELTAANTYAYVSKQGNKIRDCKQCATEKNHRRHQQLRENHLNRNFNITQARYDALLAEQGGGCKVCGTKEPGGMGAFHVDHDHSCCPDKKCCGKCIRGLLCRRCNDMLGKVEDSIEVLQEMIAYLQSFRK